MFQLFDGSYIAIFLDISVQGGKVHEVIPIGEALAQKEQHNGQPQHWETSRPTLFE